MKNASIKIYQETPETMDSIHPYAVAALVIMFVAFIIMAVGFIIANVALCCVVRTQ